MIIITALTVNYTTGQNAGTNHKSNDWYAYDTITFYDTSENYTQRRIFTYDNNGNLELSLYQVWNTNQWENGSKIFRTYDDSNNVLVYFHYYWSNSQWVDNGKTIYTYNNHNKILTRLNQGISFIDDSTTYQYDEQGNNVKQLYQRWNNNQWENTELFISEYDNNNNQVYSLPLFWRNNQWDSISQSFYVYNANNKKIDEIHQSFYNNQWKNSYRYTYTWDINGNELERTEFNWNDSLWKENRKFIKTYDSNNNLLTATDSMGTYTQYCSKKTYTYDGNNNMLTEFNEGLTAGGMWYSKTQNFYMYDERNNRLTDSSILHAGSSWYNDIVFRWEYDENSNSVLGFNQKWDFGLEDWKNDNAETITIYYNNMQSEEVSYIMNGQRYKFEASYKKVKEAVGIAQLTMYNVQLTIYPNPTRGQLIIDNGELTIGEYSIYSVVGQVVMVGAYPCGSPEMTIDVSHLASGMYFLKVDGKTVKFVKE